MHDVNRYPHDGSYPLPRKVAGFIAVALLAIVPSLAWATTLYVSPRGSHLPPFTSWANASTSLQTAIDVALPGDTVLVTNGIYQSGSTAQDGLSRIVLSKNITVRSINGYSNTVISGQADTSSGNVGPTAIRPLRISAGIIQGFTFRKGFTTDSGTLEETTGGGIQMSGGTVRQCRIAGNSAASGGSAARTTGGSISNSLFVGNPSRNPGSGLWTSQTTLRFNAIRNFTDLPAMLVLGTNGTAINNNSSNVTVSLGNDYGPVNLTDGEIQQTFSITNSGTAPLQILGLTTYFGHGSDFTLIDPPLPATINPGDSSPLTIAFNPSARGNRQAQLWMSSSDPDDDPYSVWVAGLSVDPEMAVLGSNELVIADGDMTPSASDGSHLGPMRLRQGPLTRSFAITNSGDGILHMSDISVAGPQSSAFQISMNPDFIVGINSQTIFNVRFLPAYNGIHTASVAIVSDDTDHTNYLFGISAQGIEPLIAILGSNQTLIANHDLTPSRADGTDFDADPAAPHVYTITNRGSDTLLIENLYLDGNGTGDFFISTTPAWSVEAGTSTVFTIRFIPTTLTQRSVTVQVDSDDAYNSNYVFAIRGMGYQFPQIDTAITPAAQGALAWGDYDADGDLDLLVAGWDGTNRTTILYKNTGGTFSDTGNVLPGLQNAAAAWGDYDKDGDLDFLLAGWNGTNYFTDIFHHDVGDIFTAVNAGLTPVRNAAADWGDFDNDGDMDLAIIGKNAAGALTRIYLNTGGLFTITNLNIVSVSDGCVNWIDDDQDGDLDLMIAGSTGSESIARLYRNNGSGQFPSRINFPGFSFGNAAFSDINSDGKMDLALAGNTSTGPTLQLFLNLGSSYIATNTIPALPNIWLGTIAFGDCNNDGTPDLAISGYTSSNAISAIYTNNGKGVFTPIPTGLPLIGQSCIAWADYDNDSDLDLALSGVKLSGMTAGLFRNNDTVTNAPPNPPTNLYARVNLDGNSIFSWQRPTDDHTSSSSLTYSVYVGTNPTLIDLQLPQADMNTGVRYLAAMGATGNSTNWMFRGLTPGTYYWGVQAVDSAFAGSLFATNVYVRQIPANLMATNQINANSAVLSWVSPLLYGMSNNIVMIRWGTTTYPSNATDGVLLYYGTDTNVFHPSPLLNHTNYYRLWVSHDGIVFVDPPGGGSQTAIYIYPYTLNIPTLTEWGLIILAIGLIIFGRRRLRLG